MKQQSENDSGILSMQKIKLFVVLILTIGWVTSFSQTHMLKKGPAYSSSLQKEKLGRGLIAMRLNKDSIAVSWRFLPEDDVRMSFDIYRKEGNSKPQKINNEGLQNSTYFIDTSAPKSKGLIYTLKETGSDKILAKYVLLDESEKPYLTIPVKEIPGDPDFRYSPNDASIADLTGDGEMELILKRENSGKDNSHRGVCNGGPIIEAYKLDGTFLWRVDLGINIRQGAHYTQMMVYDFDGDGKAELAVKTAEGTVFGDGATIGDVNGDGISDYVDRNERSRTYGKIMEGPEFLSVIEGATGKELARTEYIERGAPDSFGDRTGNRVDRFLGGVGYFDGEHPSILICRGYYERTVLEAWDYRNGQLMKRWRFDSHSGNDKDREYAGQGNHNLSIGDVDGDGKDEVTYGACLINDDGTGAYNTKLGHGDAMHLTDIDIDRPGLEVWDCHEHVPTRAGSELRDAATSELLWGIPSYEDVGRALAADIDPRFRGCEVWTTHSSGVYTADGRLITERTPSINMAIWWDGDLNRELLNGSGVYRRPFVRIEKWNGDGVDRFSLADEEDLIANNWTKGNPCISADLFGDWREEVVVRTKNNREVRIYMTPFKTDYRFYTLLNDVIYRNSVITQNIAYNQPTQTGFYLGSDLGRFWPEYYTNRSSVHSKSGQGEGGRPNGMHMRLQGAERKVIKEFVCEEDIFELDARYKYDTYSWKINGKEVSKQRVLKLNAGDYPKGETLKLELETVIKGCVFSDSATLKFYKE
ncbi:rhamnogalacturonan lyase [Carboxylicivirga caseinilyticus]|uniref:rhamnogalacturonan lyase n=1 Tax=Carboxylicivirga caseinilyticus TaxID=3417572 RepID=UPI003D32E68E|nr:rhamnogalacturonan lyase [Marinilabiliaceae bacterium A049]